MRLFSFGRKTYAKLTTPLDDAESRKRMIDAELGDDLSDKSEETAMPSVALLRKSPEARTYASLSVALIITNIVTLGLWVSSLRRMNSWLMEDYYNRPQIEYLGPAQVPVEYEVRRFHTGIVAGDTTEYFGPPGTTADVAWNKVVSAGLTRLTASQAHRLGEQTSKEWNATDSYVGVLGAFHQLHCLSRLRYTIFYPGRSEKFDGDHLAQMHLSERDQVRQCRKFDAIYEWATDDANEVPNAPGNVKAWQAMLNFEDSHPLDENPAED
ncbi:hypothetical protein S40288_11495 [Stachybotrys chartarum IBT 40288]|nr:hypothetical protein S40288_11495 [Stachybotrys chartarum IBT 40288]